MTTFQELSNLPTQHIPARAYKQWYAGYHKCMEAGKVYCALQ